MTGYYIRVHKKHFCSKPCCQTDFVESLEESKKLSAKSMKNPEYPHVFARFFKTEYLFFNAILKRSPTDQLQKMKKMKMDAVIDIMEYLRTDDDGTVNEGKYLEFSNEMKHRFETEDKLIQIFGS